MNLATAPLSRLLTRPELLVDRVHCGFLHSWTGKPYARKAPASTVETLVESVTTLFSEDLPEIRVIGCPHGERLHETLLSREDVAKADDEDVPLLPLEMGMRLRGPCFDEGETRKARLGGMGQALTRAGAFP